MALKQKTEGGSGGKRGHSNMCHWGKTETIKAETKRHRRRQDAAESLRGIWSWMTDEQYKMIMEENDRDIL